MSRIGKYPVVLPKGVEVTISADALSIKGPLGTLSQKLDGSVRVQKEVGSLVFEASGES